ncbi:PEP-CTERM sorting domain-containing protein [Ferribacterium limneticum]|uniref:PEP-CTERM sorting domain-containing protein n=1 Tax=Ferribacterium limneticum TaxID=76259 RepID=UPI001CFA2680|nr:PEP-CTERM sorting domain-containing protein [Ferribacterium limneticum]UCV27012.1 PEP-CTERM sorting domain-containing protein [Ferribacterium limneticum]UCV30929.1 PEP-CTERM sorting domain-containing protein [Ferribacterium limneticum]
MKKLTLAASVALVLASGSAQAELFDRGGGLLYDDVLNITWLQDANYAKTSGYDADGLMTWTEANTWAANLTFHDSARNVDYSDWRLAANAPVGADWNYTFSYGGGTDRGYNITSPKNELAYMYHINLGLKSHFSTSGASQPDYGVFGNGTSGGQADVGPVLNLQSYYYWSGSAFAIDPEGYAWYFRPLDGMQTYVTQSNLLFGWAVRSGDVAAVPEPESYAMLLAGLGLLAGVARRKKR